MAEPQVTVAVVVRDRLAEMARCLDGIATLRGIDFRLVVVDNGSTDGTAEMVTERAHTFPVPVQVLHDPGTLGAARNTALAAVATRLVAFTDSDCVPDPDWLRAGVAAMTDDVGVVQGRTEPAGDRWPGRWAATQQITRFTGLYEACNVFYRAAELRAAGGFDETVGFFGEDTAAGWNMRRAGWAAAFAPDAVVRHAVTTPGLRWQLRRGYGYRNWNALVRRYPEMRTELLFLRVFLRPRNAAYVGLVAAAAAAGAEQWWLTPLALPYLWYRRPRRGGWAGVADSLSGAAFDTAVFAGLVTGSVREKTLVL
jgi:GT2 family glycosyltransferase